MKKSILVLSALLTLVVSGICLQSCSSEYDEYTTEEYGYYTEEEIAEIEAFAEKYKVKIEIDDNYYGQKCPLTDFENEIKALSSLMGSYEMVALKDSKNKISYVSRRKNDSQSRNLTRSVEKGSWSKTDYIGGYSVNVSIEWDRSGRSREAISGTADMLGFASGSSSIKCQFAGSVHIVFSGSVTASNSYGATYKIYVEDGELNTENNNGFFDLSWGCAF